MKKGFKILVLLMPLVASACGFAPMYGTRLGATAERLSEVTVAPIDGRVGQLTRNALIDRITLRPDVPPRYRLTVALDRQTDRYGFRSDESVSRGSVRLSGHFVLTESATGRVLVDETTRSVATFDIVQSDFASVAAEREAEKRTVEQMSDQITARVAAAIRQENK